MSDVLEQICSDKRRHIEERKQLLSLDELEKIIAANGKTRGFERALKEKSAESGYALICEIKKASPSKGLIRKDFDPSELAEAYTRGGATCLSVLTDIPYFQGNDDFLRMARTASSLPVLRKDFMLEPYQILESRALGADCILLILAALTQKQAEEMEKLAMDLGMDVLLEVHDELELDRALNLGSPLIGINNRDLKTLEVDIATTEKLAPKITEDRFLIAESGLYEREDLQRLSKAGARAFLIGESLMRQENVEDAARALQSGGGAS
ncbi:indole-3-glycerol phosphate synthase TrpC [Fodinicurvata halophila]|uniref:Indole-3-glycerol phosphate synthase n=1 Tax=Fodinicurvata halophila TaxID=1419723 RepID=A0ABV8UK61_9PROT